MISVVVGPPGVVDKKVTSVEKTTSLLGSGGSISDRDGGLGEPVTEF